MFAKSGEKIAYCESEPTPPAVLNRAREYLTVQTAADYQASHFTLVSGRTGAQRSGDCNGTPVAYSLTFEDSALRGIGADNPNFDLFVPVDSECPVSGFLPARSSSGAMIEPRINRGEAIAVAREKTSNLPLEWTLSGAYVLPREGGGLAWNLHFTEPGGHDCWETAHVQIDAVSGDLLASEISTTCT